jgi:hypothetical protein
MAKSSGKGGQVFLLLILLGILVGGGTWNYQRNLKIEEADPRPYRSYSFEQLESLKAAYQEEVDIYTQRYQAASSRRVRIREGGLIGEQVDEFERVQRISQGTRAIADQYAKNQVQLDELVGEISRRASESKSWKVFLRRLTKYP